MWLDIEITGLGAVGQSESRRIRRANRVVIKDGTDGFKTELRQMTKSVLGSKVAFAWQGRIYDDGTSGFVYTKTPGIIAANMRSTSIVPVNGTPYLSLPTDNVPKYGRFRRRMPPEMVEAHFNQDLIILPGKRPQTLLGFVEVSRGRRRKAGATKKRAGAGRRVELLHMFTFVRNVKTRKVIDPDVAFQRWSRSTKRRLEEEYS